MLLSLLLPQINPYMTDAIVGVVHAAEGAAIPVGGKLMDLTVDLSAAAPHDCPAISHFRVTVRDRAFLRRLDVARGDTPRVGQPLALFSTEPDEPLDGPPARAVRVAIVGVIPQSLWDEVPS
ncbi:MAG: hypothetical protein JSR86_10305 [Proteobacteria bacterium]|nr:hypothetical protein [Pseudomonadota bacterium]